MRRRTYTVALVALGATCSGCGLQREPTETPLPEVYRALLPYRGDEQLVLVADDGERDTLLLRGYTSRMAAATRYLAAVNDRTEHYGLAVNSYDEDYRRRVDANAAMSVVPTDTSARLELSVEMQGVVLFAFLEHGQLLALADTLLAPPLDTLGDVKAIPFASEHSDPDYFAERVYWSVSRGLVGFDAGGRSWRLETIR